MDSLSIIVLNFNTYELTCNCLRSIYSSNTEALKLEVILVDNGSEEPVPIAFQELFPDVVYIKVQVNAGFAKGNNIGLEYATGSYILLLNSDTIVTDPDTFQKTIQVLKKAGDRIVLTTRLLTAGGSVQVAYGPIPNARLELIQTTFLYKLLPGKVKERLLIRFVPDENRLITSGYITATYLLLHRNVIDALPGKKLYDKTFLYGEELFWASEWLDRGIHMYYCAEVSIVHLIGQSSKQSKTYSPKIRRRYQINAEKEFLSWRYGSRTVFSIYLLRIARYLLLSPFDKGIRERFGILVQELFFPRKYIGASKQ